jgi:hypothetical protein
MAARSARTRTLKLPLARPRHPRPKLLQQLLQLTQLHLLQLLTLLQLLLLAQTQLLLPLLSKLGILKRKMQKALITERLFVFGRRT